MFLVSKHFFPLFKRLLKDVAMRLDSLVRVLDTDGMMAEYMLSDLLTPLNIYPCFLGTDTFLSSDNDPKVIFSRDLSMSPAHDPAPCRPLEPTETP